MSRLSCARMLCFAVFAASLAIAGCGPTTARPGQVTTQRTTITIPTYTWGPHDINPHFEAVNGMVPIYPYPMQDNLGREKVDKEYEALVVENEYLRVTVLPELGGHIHGVLDKTTGREMFYVNKVVKPGLIGMAGAWISGGVEFNTGPLGHTVTAVYPVACRFVEDPDGSKSIAIGHVERIYRTQWMAQVKLRPGRAFLEERIRFFNPNSTPAWYYFWNCTAVPNTDGMEFIYPMKLGTDHGYTKFYPWPIENGKDLRWTKNYDEPAGLFAYQCDQDFFGSYDHEIDQGLVAYSNHHQVLGKKGWTWGRGDDGKVAMATLTDDGTWYNEIQSGPLATQADVGVLGPHQTIEWTEWWYPVHGLDGYEFANKDVAVNVFPYVPFGQEATEPVREIRVAATGKFGFVELAVTRDGREVLRKDVWLEPASLATVALPAGITAPVRIELTDGSETLASFIHPLPLPERKPLEKAEKDESAAGLWREGQKTESGGDLKAARAKYEEALKKQVDFTPAIKSLAVMALRSGLWQQAAERLEAAIQADPNDGMAHYYRAEAAMGKDDNTRALEEAWKAAKCANTTAIGLNMVGQVYIRQGRWADAERVLREALSHDAADISTWNLLAIVLDRSSTWYAALEACEEVLKRDPLDPHATLRQDRIRDSISCFSFGPFTRQRPALAERPQEVLEDWALLSRLRLFGSTPDTLFPAYTRCRLYGLSRMIPQVATPNSTSRYYLALSSGPQGLRPEDLDCSDWPSLDYDWPFRVEEIGVLELTVKLHPDDARAWYLLGNVFYSKQRFDEARKAWDEAAKLGLEYSVLYRNIGLAKDMLDNDAAGAIAAYEKAHALNPHDQVVMRDLGRLYKKQEQWDKVVGLLEKALAEPRYRGDLMEDLARAYEHLDQLDKAAALLDARTFDQWEGQQSLHDIFETVHRRLGEKAMQAKDYATAVREFERALEYPKNLGAGKVKGKDQTALLKLRDEAKAAASKS